MKFLLDTNAFSDLMRKHSRLHRPISVRKKPARRDFLPHAVAQGGPWWGRILPSKGLLAPIRQKLTTLLVVRTAYGTGSQRKRW